MKTLQNIIWKLNRTILSGDLEKIIEVTYSYSNLKNGFYYNVTLFEEFAGVYYFEDINFAELKNITEKKLTHTIALIESILKELWELEATPKKIILEKSLIYMSNILQITITGLDFELEKAGYIQDTDEKSIRKKIAHIADLESECFWEEIRENIQELWITQRFLQKIYQQKKWVLNTEEKSRFQGYLEIVDAQIPQKHKIDKDYYIEDSFAPKHYDFYNQKISRDHYMEVYSFILKKIYNLPQVCKLSQAWSIYDGEKYLEIPMNATHKEIRYERFLKLISHEIESHYLNSYNGKNIIGNFRGAKNLEKEEWLAKTMEFLLVGYAINNIQINPEYFPKILFSEIATGTELYHFLQLFSSLYATGRDPGTEFLRQKRNYSLNHTGGQHKDISYGRWMLRVIDYLREGKDFSLLFTGKVGFEDMPQVRKLSQEYEGVIKYPLFIWEIIRQFLVCKELKKEFIYNEKVLSYYLENKYNFKGIKKFQLTERLTTHKKKICELLAMIDNYS